MKDLINIKIFLKKNIPWFEAYVCNYSCKNNPEKTLFALPKSECTRKAKIPAFKWKEGTRVQSQ